MEGVMKNIFEIRGNHAVIFLNRRDGSIIECLVDLEDLEIAQSFDGKWYAHRGGTLVSKYFYVYGNKQGKTISLHSLILETPKTMVVDHRDGNTLDNRRSNIRNVTKAQNNQNVQGSYKNNKSSGVRGVSWHKGINKWYASVMISGKQTYIGQFDNIDEASEAVKQARIKHLPYSHEAL